MLEPVPFLTKVLVPSPPLTGVRRPRLLDLLHRRLPRRLTVLTAGAGFGKTTLMAQFAEEVETPVCWLSLDSHDADPRTFVSYLLTSVRQHFPHFGRHTEALLREWSFGDEWAHRLGGVLVTELVSDIPEYLVLVLDDVHLLGPSPVWQLLDQALEHPPENCHLMLAGREALSLSVLPRLVVRQHAAILGAEDLRFTDEEVQELLRQRWGAQVPNGVLQRVPECEGWVAGVVLSGLAPDGERLETGRDREWLFRYLATEVLDTQDASTRAFLLATSILPELRPTVCNALLERSDAEQVLACLAESNSFVTRLQVDDRPSYRYHPLLGEFLSQRLRAEDSSSFCALHQRAGALAEARGEWGSALHHYQAIGNLGLLAEVLERWGDELFRLGRLSELRRAFDALDGRTELNIGPLLLRARVRLDSGRPHEAERDARTAERLGELDGNDEHRMRALAVRASALRVQGECATALRVARQVVSLADSQGSIGARAEAWKQLGISQGVMGNAGRSIAALRKSIALFAELGDEYSQAHVADQLGMAFLTRGELEPAERHFERAEQLWRRLGNQVGLAGVLNNLGVVAYYRGDYACAEERLHSARETALLAGCAWYRAYAHTSLGDLYRDTGNLAAAEEAYQIASELAVESGEHFLLAYVQNGRGELRRLQGDPASAADMSRHALRAAQARGSLWEQAVYEISLAVVECDQEGPAGAVERLSQALDKLARCGARRELARGYLCRAQAHFSARSNAQALEDVERAASLVADLGYDGFLLLDLQRSPLLVQYAASKQSGGEVVQRWADRLARPSRTTVRTTAEPATQVYPRVRVFGLGQTLVQVDDRLVSNMDWRSASSRELFFFLLSERRWVRKEELIDALWPEVEPARCEGIFHTSTYRIRRALFRECVQQEGGRYRLNESVEFWFDAAQFERLISEAEGLPRGAERAARYEDALDLYEGPFLEEFYSEWCEEHRRRLESKYLSALGCLADHVIERGDYHRAAELCERALAVDCFHEEALQKLIVCYVQLGDRATALRRYRGWVEVAHRELRIEPSPRLKRIYDVLRSGGDVRATATR